MKKVKLTKSKFAFVDDVDFEKVSKISWYTSVISGNKFYATGYNKETKQNHLLMHRFLMNPNSNQEVDHIDGNGLNNQKANLRLCVRGENGKNRLKQTTWKGKKTSSKFKGVTWRPRHKSWEAVIKINGKSIYLGLFKIEEDAAKAYDIASEKYHGQFGKRNFGSVK